VVCCQRRTVSILPYNIVISCVFASTAAPPLLGFFSAVCSKSKNVSGEKVLEKEGCENDLEAVNLDLVLLDQANLGQPAANLGALVAL